MIVVAALIIAWLAFAPKPDISGPELTPPSLHVKPEHMTGPRVLQPGGSPNATPPEKPGDSPSSPAVPKS